MLCKLLNCKVGDTFVEPLDFGDKESAPEMKRLQTLSHQFCVKVEQQTWQYRSLPLTTYLQECWWGCQSNLLPSTRASVISLR